MEIIVHERDDGVTHVALTGRLDATAAEDLDQQFSDATSGRNLPAIIDLSKIDFIASRGIALLFTNSKRLKKAGHQLVLLNPRGIVEGVLKTSKMDRVMPIAHDLDEAIRIVRSGEDRGGTADGRAASPAAEAAPQLGAPAPQGTATGTNVLKRSVKNEITELPALNADVAEFLDANLVPSRPTYAVNLAIEELFMNVIRYAYVDDDPHVIDIELAIENNQLVLRMVDDGRPFDPREGPELDLHAEDRDAGGLGLLLVLDMVDLLKYQRVDERNCVEVHIYLSAADRSSEGPVVAV